MPKKQPRVDAPRVGKKKRPRVGEAKAPRVQPRADGDERADELEKDDVEEKILEKTRIRFTVCDLHLYGHKDSRVRDKFGINGLINDLKIDDLKPGTMEPEVLQELKDRTKALFALMKRIHDNRLKEPFPKGLSGDIEASIKLVKGVAEMFQGTCRELAFSDFREDYMRFMDKVVCVSHRAFFHQLQTGEYEKALELVNDAFKNEQFEEALQNGSDQESQLFKPITRLVDGLLDILKHRVVYVKFKDISEKVLHIEDQLELAHSMKDQAQNLLQSVQEKKHGLHNIEVWHACLNRHNLPRFHALLVRQGELRNRVNRQSRKDRFQLALAHSQDKLQLAFAHSLNVSAQNLLQSAQEKKHGLYTIEGQLVLAHSMKVKAQKLLQLVQEKLLQIDDISVSDDTKLSMEQLSMQQLVMKCENLCEIVVEQTEKFLQDIETTAPREWRLYLADQIKMLDENGAK